MSGFFELTKENANVFDNLINNSSVCVLYFTAKWCPPCQKLFPILSDAINKSFETSELCTDLKNMNNLEKKVTFIKIDIEKFNDLSTDKYDIKTVPTIMFIVKGIKNTTHDDDFKTCKNLNDKANVVINIVNKLKK
jgi:thiol-disulfide isomerase/thioredoxin